MIHKTIKQQIEHHANQLRKFLFVGVALAATWWHSIANNNDVGWLLLLLGVVAFHFVFNAFGSYIFSNKLLKIYLRWETCLTLPENQSLQDISSGHKKAIRKAKAMGYESVKEQVKTKLKRSPYLAWLTVQLYREKFEKLIEECKQQDPSYRIYCEKEKKTTDRGVPLLFYNGTYFFDCHINYLTFS